MLLKRVARWLRRGEEPTEVREETWQRVESRLLCIAHLGLEDRKRLRVLARQFLAEKEFHGAQGFVLTDEVVLCIALQACLLILNLDLAAYRGWVGVVVYSGDFLIPREVTDEAGVVHEYDEPALGEAWPGGPVVLSWSEDSEDAGGANVVIHEFAHKLDMLNGVVDGRPLLPEGLDPIAWSADIEAARASVARLVTRGLPTYLDPYAAEDAAEFFAVASEAFFDDPRGLQRAHPKVYELLARFYRQDPAVPAP